MKVIVGLCPTSLSPVPWERGVHNGLGLRWCPTPCKSGFIWISPLRTRQAVSCVTPICTLPMQRVYQQNPDVNTTTIMTTNKWKHFIPSSSLTLAAELLTLSPFGGLGSGTGGCSVATHVGSALFISSLLTELSSWSETTGEKETVRQRMNSGCAEAMNRRL